MKFIADLLDELGPLQPIPTDVRPDYRRGENLKVVLFDIYGTLLISASGDVEETTFSHQALERASQLGGFSWTGKGEGESFGPWNQVLDRFRWEIQRTQERQKNENIPFPEVEIRRVWSRTLLPFLEQGLLVAGPQASLDSFILVFELLSNRIWPMPGMENLIHQLEQKGISLGLVSNAQFYTPVFLNYFLNKKLTKEEFVFPFQPDLSVFSYQKLRGKPDPNLFKVLLNPLKKRYGAEPSQVLFVGNDMLKDVLAAHHVGFQTALYAGDQRSLRLREGDERLSGIKPDYVITELEQILKIVPL